MDRLRLLRGAVQSEVDRLTYAPHPDHTALRKLRRLVQSFKTDAHSILITMLFEDAPPAVAEAAEELLGTLCDLLDRVDASLARDTAQLGGPTLPMACRGRMQG